MTRRGRQLMAVAGVTGIVTVACAWYTLAVRPYQPPVATAVDATFVSGAGPDDIRDEQLAVWQQALAADTGSALVLGQLAALHAQRARETGQYEAYRVAEAFARHSLARRTHRNGAAAATLITVLLAQHRFLDAMTVADSLVDREPDVPVYQAMRGEVAMELGRYGAAREAFARVWPHRTQLSIAPRVARWLELTGHAGQAASLLRTAARELRQRRDVASETRAWFALRLGDVEWRRGRGRIAAHVYRQGLAVRPHDPRLLAAMARLAADRQRGRDALVWAQRAVRAQSDATTLLALAAAAEAAGDTAQAQAASLAVRTLNAAADVIHRDWLLWQLDHGERVAEIAQQATADLAVRRDVHGYDLAAWARFHEGRTVEARALMQRALALGSTDPLLRQHAEAIE